MKNLFLGLVVGGLVAGLAAGLAAHKLGAKEARLQGRMSACKEIFSVIGNMFPIPLECVEFNGDAAIASPLDEKTRMSLTGKQLQ